MTSTLIRTVRRLRWGQKILIGAAFFFIIVQLWMSWFIWQGKGNAPPGFDDSYFYIMTIDLIGKHGSLAPDLPGLSATQSLDTTLRTATYNAILGVTSRLFSVSSETVYYWSFFVGKAVLLAALLFFFYKIHAPPLEQSAALLLLGAYSGTAATHGFFWVVPSFWLLLFFLVLAGLIIGPPRKKMQGLIAGFLLSIAFYFTHPLSLWAFLVLFLFTFLLAWRSGNWKKYLVGRRPFLFGLVAGFVLSGATVAILSHVLGQVQTIQSPSFQLAGIGEEAEAAGAIPSGLWTKLTSVLPSSYLMWRGYFRFMLLPPVFLFLAWTVWHFIRQKRLGLPLLFLAVLVAVAGTAIHPFGYRTISFIWPLTLILAGLGVVQAVGACRDRWPSLASAFVVGGALAIFSVVFALLFYSYSFLQQYRASADFSWDKSCAQELLTMSRPDAIIEYSDKYAASAFLANGLLERERGLIRDYMTVQENGVASQYFFVESPRAVIKRAAVEAELGRPLAPVKECGFFALYAAQPL